MYIYKLLTIFILVCVIEGRSVWDLLGDLITTTDSTVPEDAGLNIKQLANKYGYILDEHTVTTEDDYIINFHRLYKKNVKRDSPVVFLMHGILESSDSWLLQGPRDSFAYILADEGFDVWIGNARGNRYSFEHKTLSNTSTEYWKFTWEQLGIYDLPAMIDYIIEETKEDSIYYVGHSQGTTTGYVLLSMKPAYNKKIKMMFSLAPEAWMGNVQSPIIKFFGPTLGLFESILLDLNAYTGTDLYNKISWFLCSSPFNCNILYAITGYSSKINETLIPIILGHMPTGSSVLQFIHYGQLVNTGRFCRYNYGYEGNMEVYRQAEPPDYNLSNVTAPMVLFYSGADWLSHPLDVNTLKSELPFVLASIYLNDFNHMDYVYSSEARDAIYMKIIRQINKFERNDSNDVTKFRDKRINS